jgi:hypothetical protein
MLHFDNAPVHNTEGVQENLANVGFRRMEHPPYTPDFAPYDFLLFGAMKQRSQGNILRPLTTFYGCGGISGTAFCRLLTDRFSGMLTAIAARP